MGIGRLILRMVVGSIFFAHGMQKLVGAFGGGGIEGTETMMKSLRMHPPRQQAMAAGVAEAGGGALIALGAAMPLGTAATTTVMSTAVRKVHVKNGFFNANGGYEFNLLLAAAATALTIDGPGPLSIDGLVGKRTWGVFWGLLAAGAGLVASSLAIWGGETLAKREEAQPEAQPIT